tara:strand:- start:568 stop:885 length:318 start_codon:yes stop_codon:yes gene_type:complete
MTWFDLVKISLIDEVRQHLEETDNNRNTMELHIEKNPYQYGMNKQRGTFYVNFDFYNLVKHFQSSDDVDIIHIESELLNDEQKKEIIGGSSLFVDLVHSFVIRKK